MLRPEADGPDAFSGTVFAHDGMNFTGVDREIQTLENFPAPGDGDASVEIFDF